MNHKSQYTIVTESGSSLHRTQVLLEEWQFQQIQRRARRSGTSVAALIRGLVEKSLEPPKKKTGIDAIIGLGAFEPVDHDEELYG